MVFVVGIAPPGAFKAGLSVLDTSYLLQDWLTVDNDYLLQDFLTVDSDFRLALHLTVDSDL